MVDCKHEQLVAILDEDGSALHYKCTLCPHIVSLDQLVNDLIETIHRRNAQLDLNFGVIMQHQTENRVLRQELEKLKPPTINTTSLGLPGTLQKDNVIRVDFITGEIL